MNKSNLKNTYVCVIDNDYEILYMNDNFAKFFDKNINDTKCYELFCAFNTPCKKCIVKELRELNKQCTSIEGCVDVSNVALHYTAFRMKWGNVEDAIIIVFTNQDNDFQRFDIDAKVNELTGLHTSRAFYQSAEEILENNPSEDFLLLYIDIEHFKLYNDWYGEEQGNILLKHIASHLKKVNDYCNGVSGYLGNDDFVMLIAKSKIDIKIFEKELISTVTENDVAAGFLPSIGVYPISRSENISVFLMCDRAGIAANTAKNHYTSRVAYYNESLKHKLEKEHQMMLDMKYALDHDEFLLYLQPQCHMETNKIIGFEALVRWNHHEQGMIPPNDFVPVLENNGFILKLDLYIWEKACALLRKWLDKNYRVCPFL